jgi:HAD superfamily hydrolase (TIGR01509 family)
MTRDALPRPLQGVLLDMDGTLVDTEHLHAASTNVILGRFGHHLTDAEFSHYIGWSERRFWESLKVRFGIDPAPEVLAEMRSEVLIRMLDEPLQPLAGVRELIALLDRHGIPRAVASSSLRSQITATLRSAGLEAAVRVYVSGYDDVAAGKPAPDAYLEAARRLGVDPRACIAIEDSFTGLTSARAAGAFTIGIPCASHPDSRLQDADLRLESLGELLPLLNEHLRQG